MNPTGLVKFATDIIVSAGVGAVVGNAIKATSPLGMKTSQKIMVGVGSVVVSGMVGKNAANYATEQIEETITQIKEIKTNFRKKQD